MSEKTRIACIQMCVFNSVTNGNTNANHARMPSIALQRIFFFEVDSSANFLCYGPWLKNYMGKVRKHTYLKICCKINWFATTWEFGALKIREP